MIVPDGPLRPSNSREHESSHARLTAYRFGDLIPLRGVTERRREAGLRLSLPEERRTSKGATMTR